MRSRLHSILKIRSYKGYESAVVVCETAQDEKDVFEMAARVGDEVTYLVRHASSIAGPDIFLNDYEFVDG